MYKKLLFLSLLLIMAFSLTVNAESNSFLPIKTIKESSSSQTTYNVALDPVAEENMLVIISQDPYVAAYIPKGWRYYDNSNLESADLLLGINYISPLHTYSFVEGEEDPYEEYVVRIAKGSANKLNELIEDIRNAGVFVEEKEIVNVENIKGKFFTYVSDWFGEKIYSVKAYYKYNNDFVYMKFESKEKNFNLAEKIFKNLRFKK